MSTVIEENKPCSAQELLRPHVSRLRPYVPGKPIAEVKRELGFPQDYEITKLASNENVLGPSPAAVEAVRRAAEKVFIYPEDSCYDLKNALADFWDLTSEHFILGNGSDEVIHFLMLAMLGESDEIVTADPSFSQYEAAARQANCINHAVPLTADHRHDLPAMLEKVNENTKIVFITNPNNPTGTVVNAAEFDAFIKALPPKVLVVLDEAYYEYVGENNTPDGLAYMREGYNILLLRTFSKAYALAGLRVGYGIGRPELIGWLQQVRGPFNINSLAQAAATASLGDATQVARTREFNEAGKKYFYAQLEALGLTYIPTEANFLMVDVKREGVAVFKELMRHGVIVRADPAWNMPHWIRVTIGTPEMNERFIRALRAVLEIA